MAFSASTFTATTTSYCKHLTPQQSPLLTNPVASFRRPFSLTCSSLSPKQLSSSIQFQPNNDNGFGYGGLPAIKKKNGVSDSVQTSAVLTGSFTSAEGLRFAVVVARFNEIVTRPMLEGALGTFKHYSVREEDVDVVWVPGCFEIGLVAEKLGRSGKYHGIVCIGAVIRGDTTHYDAVANAAASGVLSAGQKSGVPCIFGVITTENMDQALNRAGGKSGNKGSEAALTAIEMASLCENHLNFSK